jgi:hypothetical protein
MKNLLRYTSLSLLAAASVAVAATPPLQVTVSDAGGKVAYQGKTTSAGTFATGKLKPGEYVVQFNGTAQGTYALVLSAGKNKVSADSVAGEKFGKGGVAMKVKVGEGMNISGQVAAGGAVAANGGDAKVKIVNGKKWYFVESSTGSHIGGHWVEEGTPEARNVQGLSKDAIGHMQERGAGALPGN